MKRISGRPTWYLTDRQRHEAYEGRRRLLEELPLIGRMQLLDALPKSLVPHVHSNAFELHYILKGTQHFWVGQNNFRVGPGTAFLTKPGEVHGAVNDTLLPGEWYWVHIWLPKDVALPGLSLDDTGRIRRAFEATGRRVVRMPDELHVCFEHLLCHHRIKGLFSEVAARGYYHILLALLAQKFCTENKSETGRLYSAVVEKALKWIDANLTETFSIKEVAAAAGISESGLRRRFWEELRQTPLEYLHQQRIQYAKRLLEESSSTITQVAFDVGFNSSAYFTAVFRRLTGETPSFFRQKCRQNARL